MSRRHDMTPHFGRSPQASAMSGRRPRVVPPRPESEEEFAEPDLALVSLAEERGISNHPAAPAVLLAEARQQLAERDLLIESLTLRVAALEGELASMRALPVATAVADVEANVEEISAAWLITEPVMEVEAGDLIQEPTTSERASVEPTHATLQRISLRCPDAPNGSDQRDVELLEDARLFADLSGDLARGGIFIATHVPLPLGATVSVDLESAELGVLSVAGQVTWTRNQPDSSAERPGIGIAFSELAVESESAIRGLFHDEPLFVEL